MSARARSEQGFTTIELLLAIFIAGLGLIAVVGTFDVSRRLATLAEMKEAAAHVAEQRIEQMRTLDYGELALNGDPVPAGSTDANNPAYYLGSGSAGKTYRWDQRANAPAGHTEPLVIDPVDGQVAATAEAWSDGRIKGHIYLYVTCAATVAAACEQGPETTAYKRVTVAVTVENASGPRKPTLISTLVANPETADGVGSNPLDSPETQCSADGVTVDCSRGVEGRVRTWYLYDTTATRTAREPIAGSHPTHPTVAPSGTCTAADASGCPVPDLMALEPPPAPSDTPPLYNYSNEITGGSTPGGAVIRRDAECGGTVTNTDNTKGHLWVSSPLSDPITLTGDAAVSVSTQTFNGVTASGMLCVRFYNVPGDLSNLVANPPTAIGSAGHKETSWPRSPSNMSFAIDFLDGAGEASIPAGNRLGVRFFAAASTGADLVVIYDHPMHPSFVQVNEAE
jgi:type II secretory pathway pseudopilin PulG